MYTEEVGTTWAGTHAFRASGLHLPRTLAEAADIIASHDRIRAVGSRHSFNDIADGHVQISLEGIPADFDLNADARTVTVGSRATYGAVAAWLHERGWALRNMGSLPHISVGGASATGTHGSGDSNRVLADAVAAVSLITADGTTRDLDRSDSVFPGVVLSLGALGVISRLTLDVEPAYDVRQDVYTKIDWDAVISQLDVVMASGYSVSVFTTWDEPTVSRILVKSRIDADGAVPDELLGAARLTSEDPAIAALGANRTLQGGVPGPWLHRLPHFRGDVEPSNGDEIQSEYFVARGDGPAAVSALRSLATEIAPHLIATEIRSVAADTLWLSPSYRQPTLGIHFTWRNHPDAVAALLPRIEQLLEPFQARPHWGKVYAMAASALPRRYPKFADFAALRARFDPSGKFMNDYLHRVFD